MVVAVVGAGLAGAACARALTAAGVSVEVHDRGRVPGGRMASRRIEGRYVDVGASYLTARDPGFQQVVDGWVARGLAHPWTDSFHVGGPAGERKAGPLRYGTPGGLRSLVADLLDGIDVRQGSQVRSVGEGPTLDGRAYDAVVLAMPDPQALPLLDPALTAERTAVLGREWAPVLAVAAGFPVRTWELDGCFVDGSEVLSWVADDGRRRGDGAPVLVAHSTASYAGRFLTDPEAGAPGILAALRDLLAVGDPSWSHVQRWTLARPTAAREQPYHLGPQRIGLCGDGWGAPRVETAWVSGTRLGQALVSAGPAGGGPGPAGC